MKKILIDYSIPLDSVALFNRQVFHDFGVTLDSMTNVNDPTDQSCKYRYDVKINYSGLILKILFGKRGFNNLTYPRGISL